MSFGYSIRPKADLDMDEIADYLAQRSSLETAQKFFSEIDQTFSRLASQPVMGWRCKVGDPRLSGVRVFRVKAPFEDYLIFYQFHRRQIEILRVLHGSQDLESLLGTPDSLD